MCSECYADYGPGRPCLCPDRAVSPVGLRFRLSQTPAPPMPVAGTESRNTHVGAVRSSLSFGDVVDVSVVYDPEEDSAGVVVSVWDETGETRAVAAMNPADAIELRDVLDAAIAACMSAQTNTERTAT